MTATGAGEATGAGGAGGATGTAADPHAKTLPRALLLIGVVMAVTGSVGGPLITSVATTLHVSLAAAQWTLTVSLLAGAVSTPVLGRLGSGARRRPVVLAALGVIVAGSVLTLLPLPLGALLVGRAAQGCGLALGPLMMASAREHLWSSCAPHRPSR